MRDKRGAMPFAVIAVMILVASVACGAVAANYERASQEAHNIEEDAESMDAALEGMESFVNRGLAEIIRDVSVNGSGGLEDRKEQFNNRADSWLRYQFPMVDNGAHAELDSFEIELGAQPLKLASEDGYVPAYLKATGTVKVVVSTGFGGAKADLEISTDGSCTLPLAAEQGSLFERMAAEGSVSLSEMMSYQLTSLAQTRVMNGYGALNAYGGHSTDKILTKQDVLDAYKSSMEILKALCFRDGKYSEESFVDPADIAVSDEGKITIDLQAVYSQAVASLADDIAIKWYDYMYGNTFLDAIQNTRWIYRNAQLAMVSFMKGQSPFDASPYLKAVMDLNGISEDEYRYPGSGTTVFTAYGQEFEIKNPSVDILKTKWIKSFRLSYENERKWLLEQIGTLLRMASVKMGEQHGLATIVVDADPFDETRFGDALRASIERMLEACESNFRSSLPSAILESGVTDPLYGAVCDAVYENRDSYVLEKEFESRTRKALSSSMSEKEIEAFLSSEQYTDALESYRAEVYSDLEVFEDPEKMPSWRNGFLEWTLSEVCSVGLGTSGVSKYVGERIMLMCQEMVSTSDMNSCGEVLELHGESSFDVEREEGGVSYEKLVTDVSMSPVTSAPKIVEKKCVHAIGFDEDYLAGYTTVFSVSLTDTVRYELTGTGAMSSSMGSRSCTVSGGFPVSVSFEVVVSSGWALAGVEYSPSCTVLTDLWEKVLPMMEPILEPLKKVMEILKKIMAAVGDRISEAAMYASSYLEELYNDIIVPLKAIAEWAKESLEEVFEELASSIGVSIGFGEQSVSMSLLGYDLKIITNAVSLAGKTKTLFTLELSKVTEGRTVTVGVTLKTSGGIEADDIRFIAYGSIVDPGDENREPWKVKLRMDPLLRNGKHLITVDGRAGRTSINLILPDMIEYHELGLRLSDVPGIGDVLSNIPLPLIGVKAEVDAGFSLKYSAPLKFGLIINELETNPAGDDKGNEWIELLNNSESTIDLDGYTLTASSDWKTKVMTLSGTIAPGETLDIEPTFVMVNSSGKYTRSGEAVTLKDPDGNIIDKTPTLKDGDNDSKTWHRDFDGSTEWVFSEGTRGSSNGGRAQAVISAGDLKDIAWTAVQEAFDDIGAITDADSLEKFTERLVYHTVDGVIDQVTGFVVEASVYVSVDMTDLTSSAKSGFRAALRTDSQLAEDCLKFIAGKLEALLLDIDNPYSISLGKSFMENIDLEVGVHVQVGFPEFLKEGIDLPNANLEGVFRTNLASISGLFGEDIGRPETMFGIVIRDCPMAGIPSVLKADSKMKHDLWLMKATVKW